MPDTDDLRLLAEIINNGSIGLPQAAWNARMSQAEAAARFVTMAERGMPLRLVAEGDRQLLWQIAQAGPATGGVPVSSPAPVAPPAPVPAPVSGPEPDLSAPAAAPTVEPQPVQQLPVAPPLPPPPPPPPSFPPGPPVQLPLPPASAVPPHEQAIAGAVPLGQPPFGTPAAEAAPVDAPRSDAVPVGAPTEEAPAGQAPVEREQPDRVPSGSAEPSSIAPQTGAGQTWGVPGSATWARSDAPAGPPTEAAPGPVLTPLPPLFPPSVLADFGPPAPHDPQPGTSRHSIAHDAPADPASAPPPPPVPSAEAQLPEAPPAQAPQTQAPQTQAPQTQAPQTQASSPTRRVMISGQPTQTVTGLFGEHLSVSLQQIIDPADQILSQAGYRLEPGERALLVQTNIGNQGPIDYESLPDLYLVLVSGTGSVLQKAAMAVAQFPAHRVGVPAGANGSGWTVFLVPAATEVAEVRWSVRPDLVNRTVSWGFGPA